MIINKTRAFVLMGLSLLLVICLATALGAIYFRNAPTSNPDPREEAIEATKKLLDTAQKHPTGSLPTSDPEFPSHLWVNEECWRFLQKTLALNNNQYSLEIADYYNAAESPNPWRDAVEVWVQVDFFDGQSAQVLFSQGGLAGCRELE